jgi:hypothetical protein
MYAPGQQEAEARARKATSWINTMLISLQLLHMYNKGIERRNTLLTLNFGVTLTYVFYDAMQRAITHPASDLLCGGPTVWHMMTNAVQTAAGGEEGIRAGSCYFYAILYLYMEFIFYVCVLLFVVETWLHKVKNVLKFEFDLTKYQRYYYGAGLIYALANSLLVNFYSDSVMASPGKPFTQCKMQIPDFNTNFLVHYLPFVIIYAICLVLGLHIFVLCIRMYLSTPVNFSSFWRLNSTFILYIPVFLIFYASILIQGECYSNLVTQPRMKDSTEEWVTCLFQNFKSSADQPVVDELCGVYPSYVIPFRGLIVQSIIKVIYNICTLLATIDSDVVFFWYNWYRLVVYHDPLPATKKRMETTSGASNSNQVIFDYFNPRGSSFNFTSVQHSAAESKNGRGSFLELQYVRNLSKNRISHMFKITRDSIYGKNKDQDQDTFGTDNLRDQVELT